MSRTPTRTPARRAMRAKQPRTSSGPSRTQLAVAAVVAIAAVVALVVIGSTSSQAPATSPSPEIRSADHVRGDQNAPVTIEEWADFQCPACGQFARTTEPQLIASYIGKGQVRLVFHHFAFLGDESQWAAEASECANEQGRFWEFHDRLYASQSGENRGAFSKANLKRIGEGLGLGTSFGACVDSGRYAQRVRDDVAAGTARGVQATPTLFVNGRKIEGAVPFDQLKAIVDPLLASR